MRQNIDENGRNEIYSHKESDYCGVKTMTLITAIKTDEAIIVSADSRGLFGQSGFIDNQEKIFKVNNCVIGIAGMGEMGQTLLYEHREIVNKKDLSIHALALEISHNFSNSFNKYYVRIPLEQRPILNFILAGYNNSEVARPNPTIYTFMSTRSFFPELSKENIVFGGFSQYAFYLFSKYYKLNISKERAKILSVYMIKETASLDFNVGGKIHVIEILPSGKCIECSEEEVKEILLTLDKFNENIYEEFVKLKMSSISQT